MVHFNDRAHLIFNHQFVRRAATSRAANKLSMSLNVSRCLSVSGPDPELRWLAHNKSSVQIDTHLWFQKRLSLLDGLLSSPPLLGWFDFCAISKLNCASSVCLVLVSSIVALVASVGAGASCKLPAFDFRLGTVRVAQNQSGRPGPRRVALREAKNHSAAVAAAQSCANLPARAAGGRLNLRALKQIQTATQKQEPNQSQIDTFILSCVSSRALPPFKQAGLYRAT